MKAMVDCLNGSYVGYSNFHFILSKCRNLFSSLPNSTVSFVRKLVNQVAHILVGASRFHVSHHVHNNIPHYIFYLIMNETH